MVKKANTDQHGLAGRVRWRTAPEGRGRAGVCRGVLDNVGDRHIRPRATRERVPSQPADHKLNPAKSRAWRAHANGAAAACSRHGGVPADKKSRPLGPIREDVGHLPRH
jgi:hypothetical protein